MWTHKRLAAFALMVSTCAFGTGCQTTDNNNAVGGAVVGTGLGALTGAIVGSAFGRRDAAAGALIGAAAGGIGGALVGHAQDEKNEQNAKAAQAQYQQAQAAAEQAALSNADVIYMVKNGLSAEVIVNSIRSRGGRFDLTPDAIIQLKGNGVSDYLIQVMQSTPPPSATVLPPGQVVYPGGPAVGVYVAPRPYYGYGWHRDW
jgi:outer membrane lipoprotein SlyB